MPPILQMIYFAWPFKNVEVFDRLAEGLVKAGLRGDPSDYYKVVEENKLTGKEIRETFYGHTKTGITPWFEWWAEYDKEGNINLKRTGTDSGDLLRALLGGRDTALQGPGRDRRGTDAGASPCL